MLVKSNIRFGERVTNSRRKTNGHKQYYPAVVTDLYGESRPALFSEHQIAVACRRAEKQPEDAPTGLYVPDPWYMSLLRFLRHQ